LARDRARYARLLLEVVAIFGAVFLGFLADDYREYRGDRTRERELLSQLMRDLVADSAQLTEASLPSANRAAALTWLHNNLRRLDVPRDSVIDVLGHVEISTQYSPVTFTYTGLKTSGRLDLIRDDALRDQLVNYFEDRVPYLQILTDGVLREEDEWWNLLAPHVSFEPHPTLATWPKISDVDLSSLRADRRLAWATADFGNWSQFDVTASRRALELNRSLRDAIAAYLAGF
jgi:hypothetical protein